LALTEIRAPLLPRHPLLAGLVQPHFLGRLRPFRARARCYGLLLDSLGYQYWMSFWLPARFTAATREVPTVTGHLTSGNFPRRQQCQIELIMTICCISKRTFSRWLQGCWRRTMSRSFSHSAWSLCLPFHLFLTIAPLPRRVSSARLAGS